MDCSIAWENPAHSYGLGAIPCQRFAEADMYPDEVRFNMQGKAIRRNPQRQCSPPGTPHRRVLPNDGDMGHRLKHGP